MMKISLTIDGNRFQTLDGFYNEVERVLTKGLDWRIGRNLDAFNDVLRGGFGVFDFQEPIELIWEHSDKSRSDLSYLATVQYLENKLTYCHSTAIPKVNEQLEQATNGVGPTLFDILIRIIHDNENVELKLK